MLSYLFPILLIMVWGSTKYLVALGLIFYYDYNFGESLILAITSSMMGVVFFSYTRDALKMLWYRLFQPPQTVKVHFNWRTRFIVKVRRRFGLAGIALITPILLSIPVGSMMAMGLYNNKRKVFSYMFVSITFWSVLFIGTYHALGIDITASIQQLFH